MNPNSQTSLTVKMLILTAVLGLMLWFISDTYQTYHLRQFFHTQLSQRFGQQAQEHRSLFDRQVKVYSQLAKLLVDTRRLDDYLAQVRWPHSPDRILYRLDKPQWLPDNAVLRKFVMPRHALLLDQDDHTREVYSWDGSQVPHSLIQLSPTLLQLSRDQSYLTTLDGRPYLITNEPYRNRQGKVTASLLLASPLDSEFLLDSQGLATTGGAVALLTEDGETVLVSSDPRLIPSGTKLAQLNNVYQTIGEGFFDYGSTDLVIKFVSLVPLTEVQELTQAVLHREQLLRAFATLAYILAFMGIMFTLTRRLRRLSTRVLDFSTKMAIAQPSIHTRDEIDVLEERFRLLAKAIKSETEALEYQASHDPLTDLPNRKKLNERLQSALIKNQGSHLSNVLFVSDLNHFKEINDTLGHHIGDLILQQAAERLYMAVRKTDTVARLGGDEFGILLPDSNIHQAQRVASEIVDVFNIPFVVEGHNLNVGISIGVVEAPAHGNDVNILMQRADVAMYHAKRHNSGYTVYDTSFDIHNLGRLELMSELRDAIQNERLELHYQSKLDLASGKVIGAEALLRWNHPQRGFIGPDEFIPLAEQTGLIKPLSYWVIKEAIRQCAHWNEAGMDISISINISVQCLYDERLSDTLRTNISRFGLKPSHCILELTESDIMTDPIRAKYVLAEIKSIGAKISIDDFGTGYSSLAYLKQLPVSEIKIDRSFVMEMLDDDNDRTIVHTIITLGHSLGLQVVAEGVECANTIRLLQEQKCDIAQGFHISKPLPAEAMHKHLTTHFFQHGKVVTLFQ